LDIRHSPMLFLNMDLLLIVVYNYIKYSIIIFTDMVTILLFIFSVMGNHGVGCSTDKRYGITDKHYYAYIRPDLSNQWYISIILILFGYSVIFSLFFLISPILCCILLVLISGLNLITNM
jgi:hypothetical protein